MTRQGPGGSLVMVVLAAWLLAAPPAAAGARLSGVVVDSAGAVVVGALVRLERDGLVVAEARSDSSGRFDLGSPGHGTLRVNARGLGEAVVGSASLALHPVRVVLFPERFVKEVSVTASRGARKSLPSSSSVLSSTALLTTPAGALDDALRSTPGFSLFRRSSSRVANPTAQGVTLRGISGSGASRTLVLADGLPLNDGFGSWVYWNRVPLAAIERVEVVRGASGDLYGADALGGVVQVLTYDPERPRLRGLLDVGSRSSVRASVYGSAAVGNWFAALASEWHETDGAPVVARQERGSVDALAGSDHSSSRLSVGRNSGSWRVLLRGSVAAEDRGNGTSLQVNTTDWGQLSAELAGSTGAGSWLVRTAGGRQNYFQTFSVVAPDRDGERLVRRQDTPASFGSLTLQWTQAWSSAGLLIGMEGRSIRATVNDTRFSAAGAALPPTAAGGGDQSVGTFMRGVVALGKRIRLGLGVRGDWWASTPLDSGADHSAKFFSPRLSLAWKTGVSGLDVHIAGYAAARTPTLNELYRGFRVGNVVTAANAKLEPEHLRGAELGGRLSRGRGSVRVTGFLNRLDDAITNVTLSSTPSLIARQRQNAGQVGSAGLELEAELMLGRRVAVGATVAVTDARFRHAPLRPGLEGLRVPQVPRLQGGAYVSYSQPRWFTLQGQARFVGAQFDDDANHFELNRFAVVDASASRPISGSLSAFVAVENLFDADYDVSRTPVRGIGWPRTLRVGLRMFRH